MFAITLTCNALHKAEMEYHEKCGYIIGRIHHITLMGRIDFFNTAYHLKTQTVSPNITDFQGL